MITHLGELLTVPLHQSIYRPCTTKHPCDVDCWLISIRPGKLSPSPHYLHRTFLLATPSVIISSRQFYSFTLVSAIALSRQRQHHCTVLHRIETHCITKSYHCITLHRPVSPCTASHRFASPPNLFHHQSSNINPNIVDCCVIPYHKSSPKHSLHCLDLHQSIAVYYTTFFTTAKLLSLDNIVLS